MISVLICPLCVCVCDRRCARGQVVVHHSPALKSGKLTAWKRAWHAMTHLRPYTPAPLPEFELQLQGTGSMRLEHAQVRRVQGAGGLDDAVAFAGKWPPYHSVWMQGAQDYPSCTSNDTDSSHELVDVTAIGGHGRRLSLRVQEGCLSGN